jgi:hypothetical protein
MIKKVIAIAVSLIVLSQISSARDLEERFCSVPLSGKGIDRFANVSNPNTTNRTHRKTNVWLTVHNWGYLGNDSSPEGVEDPEYPGTWAPQCEYPGGSGAQYLFMASLWIGALIQEEGYEFPRISTGNEGWFNQNEFYPGEGE